MIKKIFIITALILSYYSINAMNPGKRELPDKKDPEIVFKKAHLGEAAPTFTYICKALSLSGGRCGKEFESSGLLARHLRTEHSISPHLQDQYCSKKDHAPSK